MRQQRVKDEQHVNWAVPEKGQAKPMLRSSFDVTRGGEIELVKVLGRMAKRRRGVVVMAASRYVRGPA